MSEHTQLPWEYDGNYEVIAQRNAYESICVLNVTPRSGANAAFIVKAVNSHAALRNAVLASQAMLVTWHSLESGEVRDAIATIMDKNSAALALAGETP